MITILIIMSSDHLNIVYIQRVLLSRAQLSLTVTKSKNGYRPHTLSLE